MLMSGGWVFSQQNPHYSKCFPEVTSLPTDRKYNEQLITLWECLTKVILFSKKIKCYILNIVKVASLCELWFNITIQDKGCGNLRPEFWVKKNKNKNKNKAMSSIYAWSCVYENFPLKSNIGILDGRWRRDKWEWSPLPLNASETPSSSEEQSEQPMVFQHIWRSDTRDRGPWKIWR